MGETIYIIGHKSPDTDSICSAIAYAEFKNKLEGNNLHKPVRAGDINPETKFVLDKFEIEVPELVDSVAGKRVILVDHSETKQMPKGADVADIVEVIDHHNIGDIQTTKPILFHAEPVGSTSTIIADFYFYHDVELSRGVAGLLLSSILSDTVIFKSPTTTKKDQEMAKRLAELVGVDAYEYGMELKRAKSSIKELSDENIIMSDIKEYSIPTGTIAVGQIEVVDFGEASKRKQAIINAMNDILAREGYKILLLMVTDIMREATDLWAVGENLVEVEKAFEKQFEDNAMLIEGMVSRKKDLIPVLLKVLR